MATFRQFERLEAWKLGRELTQGIYRVTRHPTFYGDPALRDGMRRAAISITSHIAEGFDRGSRAGCLHALRRARGAAGAVRSQLYLALDAGHLDHASFDELCDLATAVARTIGALMASLRRAGSARS